jgi:hypothetical protein
MVPWPEGEALASFTASWRSAMNVSTTGTVSLCAARQFVVSEVHMFRNSAYSAGDVYSIRLNDAV